MTDMPTDAAGIESIDSLLARFEDNTHKQIGADDSQALISTFGSITDHLQDQIVMQADAIVAMQDIIRMLGNEITAQDHLIVERTTTSLAIIGAIQPWDATAAYTTEDLVINNNVVFMAIQDVAASTTEPVDGADWKALDYRAQYLELIALANRVTALEAGP